MEIPQNAISWFEIPVLDFDRAKSFYSTIFDYEMPEMMMGPNRMGILLSERGGIGGAILQGDGYVPSNSGSRVYLNANPDLNIVLNRVKAQNAEVFVEKTEVGPGMGFFAFFKDCEGNLIGLHSEG